MLTKAIVLLCFVAYARAATQCCPDIGCFTDDPPYDGLPLPWCMNDINPSYTMFTRTNLIGQSFDHTSVPNDFSPLQRTVFLIHGYQGSEGSLWMEGMKDAFLDREDINVVIVGWEGGADIINYLQAASNVRSVGAYTGLVIDNLVSSGGGSGTRMWCVGHSLGSHVCGHTGRSTTTGPIDRITGMDPAGPSFESSNDITIGLNPANARSVEVIHTDYEVYGTLRDLGHIDFYPAGGHAQPGCSSDVIPCNHFRAVEYMEESVRQDCFLARQSCTNYDNIPLSCSSCTCGLNDPCAIMGYGTDTGCQTTGIYYLDVDRTPPYCVG